MNASSISSSRLAPVLAAALLAACGGTAAAAENWPNAVQAHIAELETDCGTGVETSARVRTASFNNDGKTDYLVDEGTLVCKGNLMSGYCGATGFCSFRVFVSNASGFATSEFLARGYKIAKSALIVDGKRLRWNGTAFKAK